MMRNVKEVRKEYNLAMKHFRNAVKMGTKNLIVGELIFPMLEKKARVKKVKVIPDEAEGKEGT